jgi:hypothetical protein
MTTSSSLEESSDSPDELLSASVFSLLSADVSLAFSFSSLL